MKIKIECGGLMWWIKQNCSRKCSMFLFLFYVCWPADCPFTPCSPAAGKTFFMALHAYFAMLDHGNSKSVKDGKQNPATSKTSWFLYSLMEKCQHFSSRLSWPNYQKENKRTGPKQAMRSLWQTRLANLPNIPIYSITPGPSNFRWLY